VTEEPKGIEIKTLRFRDMEDRSIEVVEGHFDTPMVLITIEDERFVTQVIDGQPIYPKMILGSEHAKRLCMFLMNHFIKILNKLETNYEEKN
jgi:hypothetical protein